MRRKLLEALQADWNVSSAAAWAGVARPNVYRMRKAWPALDQELSRIPSRQRIKGDPEVGPPSLGSEGAEGQEEDADSGFEARMRKLGLDVLAEIAKDVKQRAQDRVSAARALTQATRKTSPTSSAPSSSLPPAAPAPAAEVEAITSEQVAAMLRVRPA